MEALGPPEEAVSMLELSSVVWAGFYEGQESSRTEGRESLKA